MTCIDESCICMIKLCSNDCNIDNINFNERTNITTCMYILMYTYFVVSVLKQAVVTIFFSSEKVYF